MTDDGAILHRAVIDNPDDETARLVYADWLDEHERPDEACDQRLAVQTRRILLTPDDDAPRLEYAHVCCRYGHTERGNYVRRSVMRKADIPTDENFLSVIIGLSRVSTPKYGIPPQWRGHWSIRMHRGFVYRLELSAAEWLASHHVAYWHPEQTAACPECELGGADNPPAPLTGCPVCRNTGRLRCPFAPTAQPIREVAFIYQDAPSVAALWRVWTHRFRQPPGTRTLAQACGEVWPGIAFDLPT